MMMNDSKLVRDRGNQRIRSLWREPLLHFLIIGAAIFLYYGLTREQAYESPASIDVDRVQIAQLASNFKRTWLRPPTENELNALTENHVREEVFYRSALTMGLDQNDPIVRRRMLTKLEFLLEDLSVVDTSDEDLQEYMQQNSELFRTEPRLSFQQVYLNADKRQDPASDAEALLEDLRAGTPPESLGDHSMLASKYEMARQSEIAYSFGERFAEEIAALEPDGWVGPFYSPYGVHLLKVSAREDARLPALEEVRAIVEREYQAQRAKEQKALAYQRLRETFEINIEAPDLESAIPLGEEQ
jgi:hypothetical protein